MLDLGLEFRVRMRWRPTCTYVQENTAYSWLYLSGPSPRHSTQHDPLSEDDPVQLLCKSWTKWCVNKSRIPFIDYKSSLTNYIVFVRRIKFVLSNRWHIYYGLIRFAWFFFRNGDVALRTKGCCIWSLLVAYGIWARMDTVRLVPLVLIVWSYLKDCPIYR